MNWLLYFLAAFSLSWGITRSELTYPIRIRLGWLPFITQLVNCVICMGFWIGVAAAFFRITPEQLRPGFPGLILSGLVTSAACFIIGRYLGVVDGDSPRIKPLANGLVITGLDVPGLYVSPEWAKEVLDFANRKVAS